MEMSRMERSKTRFRMRIVHASRTLFQFSFIPTYPRFNIKFQSELKLNAYDYDDKKADYKQSQVSGDAIHSTFETRATYKNSYCRHVTFIYSLAMSEKEKKNINKFNCRYRQS